MDALGRALGPHPRRDPRSGLGAGEGKEVAEEAHMIQQHFCLCVLGCVCVVAACRTLNNNKFTGPVPSTFRHLPYLLELYAPPPSLGPVTAAVAVPAKVDVAVTVHVADNVDVTVPVALRICSFTLCTPCTLTCPVCCLRHSSYSDILVQ